MMEAAPDIVHVKVVAPAPPFTVYVFACPGVIQAGPTIVAACGRAETLIVRTAGAPQPKVTVTDTVPLVNPLGYAIWTLLEPLPVIVEPAGAAQV